MRIIRFFLLFCLLSTIFSCSIFKKKQKTIHSTENKSDKNEILKKYSGMIGTTVDNEKLYTTIDKWIGVPYKFGGKSMSGIDCSNFTCFLMREVFAFPPNYYLPSSKLAEQGVKIDLKDAREGDLVFFSINQNSKISHVGIYLKNNYFVHASTSKGVIISSLSEEYYKKRFVTTKRVR